MSANAALCPLPCRRGGFTLLEVVLAAVIAGASFLAVGASVVSGTQSRRESWQALEVQTWAQTYVESALGISFGDPTDPFPTTADLDEFFDGDSEIGGVTLFQLTLYPGTGWVFSPVGFPFAGSFRIVVDNDLNGDGTIDPGLESSNTILRIQVFFDERLILETTRFNEATT